jgi:hypothetical protein
MEGGLDIMSKCTTYSRAVDSSIPFLRASEAGVVVRLADVSVSDL